VRGVGTKFSQQVKAGDLLSVRGLTKDGEGIKVTEVKGDTHLVLAQTVGGTGAIKAEFKVIPHLDQSALYQEVTNSLATGTCICLFPEGGSHDRADLLPLKAGVAVMALAATTALRKGAGALAGKGTEEGNRRVRIVPCGLNYFQGHRFRSHVLVEFGKPIEVTDEILELYAKDRREAYASLLKVVEQRMKSVTILAPDLQTLQAILMCRRLYQPDHVEVTADKYLEVNRRFIDAYVHFQSEPQIQEVKNKALEYIDKLKVWGLHDHQVVTLPPYSKADRYILLIGRFSVLATLVLLALPGLVLNLPVGAAARTLALRHAKQALAGSNVKISGRDVIASYKILVTMVLWPLTHLFYTAIVVYMYGWRWGILSWFVLFPLIAYASVRIVEVGREMWEQNLLLSLSLFPGGDKYHKELLVMREELQKAVRSLTNELGPKLPYWKDRIFTEDQFQPSSSSYPSSPPSRVSYVKKGRKK